MAREVFATYMGYGQFEVRQRRDREKLDYDIGAGDLVKVTVAKSRSEKQTQFFYAWVREVYANLPENCPESFKSWEQLRGWLLYKTGNVPCISIPIEDFDGQAVDTLKRFLSRDKQIFFENTDTHVNAYIPPSTRIDGGMDHQEFTEFMKGAKELAQMLVPGLDVEKLNRRVRGE